MNLATLMRVVGTGATIANSFSGGNTKLGSVLSAIAAGAGAITKPNDEKRDIALAKLAQAHPNADPKKLAAALEAQISALNALEDIDK